MSQNGAENSSSTSKDGAQRDAPRFMEYKVRCASATDTAHNIMVLGGPPVNIANFTTPVRLVRDPNAAGAMSAQEDNGSLMTQVYGRRPKKTRLVHKSDDDEEDEEDREQERIPWILEDFDGQHSYSSQPVVPDSKYVIFVNEGNEFRIILMNKWYRFTPKLSYHPLSIDEAEERMAKKGRNEEFDRWMMRHRPASSDAASKLGIGNKKSSSSPAAMKMARRVVNLDDEGFDYDEFVDDDDEGFQDDEQVEDDESNMGQMRPTKNLSQAGKHVHSIVKHLDKSFVTNDSGDEHDELRDPYADEPESPPSGERSQSPVNASTLKPISVVAPISSQKPATSSQSTTAAPSSPRKRARSQSPTKIKQASTGLSTSISSLSLASAVSAAAAGGGGDVGESQDSDLSAPSTSGVLITEQEIVAILKQKPMTTKDLISAMKGRLRADPRNKEIFREIVRKVAVVKSASQDEEKILEVRAEFRD